MRFDLIHVSYLVVPTKFYIWFWYNILEIHNDVFGTSNFDAILYNVHFQGDIDLAITNGYITDEIVTYAVYHFILKGINATVKQR